MSAPNTNIIAMCFNNPEDAATLSKKLGLPAHETQFVISHQFDTFLKELADLPKVDCFIVEENFQASPPTELLSKVKRSKKYKKSVTVVMVNELSAVDDAIIDASPDSISSMTSANAEFGRELTKLIAKRQKPTIPPDYNVLILDNHEAMLEIISLHLDHMDHKNFELCTSISTAKEKLAEKKFHLLLLDWNLDDGTCLDLMEFIKTDSQCRMLENNEALTMVITGRNDVDDIMTLLQYGVKDHIIKPFDFKEFEEKISYALEKHFK